MEVGAVKQAFNNEVILLKKKLDQAKIQIINKLTRKAKTLTQKKAPEHLAEKFKRKATAAVNDVMAIKKINNKDIAKFAITHTGSLNDFLNKPVSSPTERACARLLLHKALQDKYNLLRSRFMDVPIKDLFMSRQERLKIKKEERDIQKLKKKEKEDRKKKKESEKKNTKTPVQAEGDWNVEDIDIDELILNKRFVPKRKDEAINNNHDSGDQFSNEADKTTKRKNIVPKRKKKLVSKSDSDSESEVGKSESDLEVSANDTDDIDDETKTEKSENLLDKSRQKAVSIYDYNNESEVEEAASNLEVPAMDSSDHDDSGDVVKERNDDEGDSESHKDDDSSDDVDSDDKTRERDDDEEDSDSHKDDDIEESNSHLHKKNNGVFDQERNGTIFCENIRLQKCSDKKQAKEDNRKKLPKVTKDRTKSNKKFSEKILTKKAKKDSKDIESSQGSKIVDPFFITATGENYMSVVEPRSPDEVKDVHKQGNRQIRRAAMFGYVAKARPKFNNNFSSNKSNERGNFSKNNSNSRFGDQDGTTRDGFRNRDTGQVKFDKRDRYPKNDFGNENSGDQGKAQNFKRKFQAPDSFDKKSSEPEKLHPSWAAKKKISAILPFQGKKTVFE